MSTVNGLPAHVLLVHFLVVLAPLTAVLAVLCALWPAARRRLAWPVLALAAFCLVLTPITTEAGEWLEHRVGRSPLVHTHAELGDTMIYVSAALFVAAALRHRACPHRARQGAETRSCRVDLGGGPGHRSRRRHAGIPDR